MPVLADSSPLEDGVDTGATAGAASNDQTAQAAPDNLLSDDNLLQLARAADRTSREFAQQMWLSAWDRNYKAFRSEHFIGSKYLSDEYKNRSRLFRPKTRSAVIKDLASTAGSLFATIDAVTVTPGDETDKEQAANAAVMQELINYRLDRTSGKNAIPWFLTSMGARQDAVITAICCSKQYWDYKTKIETKVVTNPQTGAESTVTREKVLIDKPCIDLLPPENIDLHPAAHWMDPINDGVYFTAWYPMVVSDVRSMMEDDRFPWREVTDAQLLKARVQQFETGQVRRAREGGKDRMNDQRTGIREFDVVWVAERFIRIEGEDYCFWTLANQTILSDPVPTEEAYPAYGGERPYKLGYGALEAHRIVPQSNVEAGQQIQQEINDVVNLRLDNVKEALKPLTLVKRGSKVDVDRLKRRGQNTIMQTENPKEDIVFDRPSDVSASSYTEMERLNVDFDDLVGVFNSGSVQTNRTLNETVGGMRLLSGAANATTEFQVRIWVETWVEPVLAQIAKLEAYYESDAKVLAIAKKRANMFKRFGMDELTDEMLQNEVYVRVAAGVGSADPMQKLQKLEAAVKVFQPIAQASKEFQTGAVQPNIEEFVNEIFGNAGIRDAFDRLFTRGPAMPQPGEQPPVDPANSPEALAAQAADKEADRKNKLDLEKLKSQTKIASQLIGHRADQRAHARDLRAGNRHKFVDVLAEALREETRGKQRAQQAQENRLAGGAGPAGQQPPFAG